MPLLGLGSWIRHCEQYPRVARYTGLITWQTADAISTCIFTLTSQPHVLPKAHAELDRVIGRDRMPEFADQDDLPYCNAVIREIMRWRSVIAGGLSHASTEDDVYNGYLYVCAAESS